MTAETLEQPVTASPLDLDLEVRIVTTGPVTAALLCTTDNGCNTVQGSDC